MRASRALGPGIPATDARQNHQLSFIPTSTADCDSTPLSEFPSAQRKNCRSDLRRNTEAHVSSALDLSIRFRRLALCFTPHHFRSPPKTPRHLRPAATLEPGFQTQSPRLSSRKEPITTKLSRCSPHCGALESPIRRSQRATQGQCQRHQRQP